MKTRVTWPSEVIGRQDLALGDLFVFDYGGVDLLILCAKQANANCGVVLAQFGGAAFDDLPSIVVPLEYFIDMDANLRRITGDLLIEPRSEETRDLISIVQEVPAPHGGLVTTADGSRGIYLRSKGAPGLIFDLATGMLAPSAGRRAIEHWCLSWSNGEKTVVLCAF